MCEPDTDPYLYLVSRVLRNLLGIHNAAKLATFERRFTAARADEGLPHGQLDYKHYKSIHRHLFQDVYDGAGEPHTVNMTKGGSPFCRIEFIDSEMTKVFKAIRSEIEWFRVSDGGGACSALSCHRRLQR